MEWRKHPTLTVKASSDGNLRWSDDKIAVGSGNRGHRKEQPVRIWGKLRRCCCLGKVAIIVLECWAGLRPDGLLICHKNDIATDDRVENLYWGTKRDNMRDAINNERWSPHRGWQPTEHTRRLMSEAHKGKIRSPETIRKLSESQKGRVFSDETRAKMSAAAVRRCERAKQTS